MASETLTPQPREALRLRLHSASNLPNAVSLEKLACSPTLDLLVSVDSHNTVSIRRANGEPVSKPAERHGSEVQAVRWKPDGQYVAAAWSDGVVRLMGIESTKTLHQITPRRLPEDGPAPLKPHQKHQPQQQQRPHPRTEYVAWSRHLTGNRNIRRRRKSAAGADASTAWQDALPSALAGLGLEEQEDMHDFPREITFLEVESSLPKISPLPVSGGTGEDTFVFSSRTSLDFVFRDFRPEDADKVDIMIIGTAAGDLHLTIYDTFDVGVFRYSLPAPTPANSAPDSTGETIQQQQAASASSLPLRLVCHASHPAVSTHSLLLRKPAHTFPQHKPGGQEQQAVATDELYLVPMDLHFIHSSPINLSLLASKITTLQKLLRYIHQTQNHMSAEWSSARELPARFLANASEELASSPRGPVDVVQALYHTCLTGHANSIVQEWLVDTVAERGHKRWDKAVTGSLENLRALVLENMLPALERAAVILSRLLGVARFHEASHRSQVGFSAAKVSRLMEVVSCLTVVSHRILLHVMDELDLFATFSSWLRFQIDRFASSSESNPPGQEDLSEPEAMMDNGKVLRYISRYLMIGSVGGASTSTSTHGVNRKSSSSSSAGMWAGASIFFGALDPRDVQRDTNRLDDGAGHPLLDLLEKQMKTAEEAAAAAAASTKGRRASRQDPQAMRALPRVEFLVGYLRAKAQAVFDDIAEAERRSVRFGKPTRLVVGDGGTVIGKVEMRMCALRRKPREIDGLTLTALAPRDRQNELYIFRTKVRLINGISSGVATDVCALALKGGKLVEFKFLNEKVMIVLWKPDGSDPACLFRILIHGQQLAYTQYTEGTAPNPVEATVEDVTAGSPKLEFISGGGGDGNTKDNFDPIWMEIKEPSDARGHVPARACLLGSDRVTYRVFELPDSLQLPV